MLSIRFTLLATLALAQTLTKTKHNDYGVSMPSAEGLAPFFHVAPEERGATESKTAR
jgi:hypothetical protein